jgi:hypothetical protein
MRTTEDQDSLRQQVRNPVTSHHLDRVDNSNYTILLYYKIDQFYLKISIRVWEKEEGEDGDVSGLGATVVAAVFCGGEAIEPTYHFLVISRAISR